MSTPTAAVPTVDCADDSQGNVARSLLGWLALAGPIYLITSVVQGILRPGFSFARHDWSLLANGSYGWIQTLSALNPMTFILEAARGFVAGDPTGGAFAFGIAAALVLLLIPWAVLGLHRAEKTS